MSTKTCPICKTTNPQEANYCRHCGTKFDSAPEILYFISNQPLYHIGDHAVLYWETSNVDRVTLNGSDVTDKKHSFFWVTGNMDFTLVATKGGYNISKTIRVLIEEDQRKVQLSRAKRKVKKRNIVLYSIITLILLLIIGVFLYAITRNRIKATNSILEYENAEHIDSLDVVCVDKKDDPLGNYVLIEAGTLYNYGYVYGWDDTYIKQTVENIKLDSFYISRYDVIQQDYEKLMHENPSAQKNDSFPAMGMSFIDALKYCNKLSETNGYDGFYTINGDSVLFNIYGNGYRLPTKYEYAYASRDRNKHGYKYGSGNNLSEIAWHAGNSEGKVHKVGEKKANKLGLYDMMGNVYKYVWEDDTSSRISVWYIGGSYKLYSYSAETFREYRVVGGGVHDDVGFRLVFIPKNMQCGNVQTNRWIMFHQ